MAVPVLNLKAQYAAIRSRIDDAVRTVLVRHFVLGPTWRLRRNWARFGVAKAVPWPRGRTTHLSLRALGPAGGPRPDPGVHLSCHGHVSYVGARPVFVDIEPDTFSLDSKRAAEHLTGRARTLHANERVKAMIPVHLYGQPADMEPLLALARPHGVAVIEDAAQAIGATYHGKRVGGLGDVGCFSFYPTKNLGAMGDGGLAVTQDQALGDHLLRLRVYGGRQRYLHEELGFNSRLDEIQAAVLRVKLGFLAEWTARRQAIAAGYRARLAGLDLTLPLERPDSTHVYHNSPSVFRSGRRPARRWSGGADGGLLPAALHLQPMYRELGYGTGDFPEAERAAREVLCLPMYPELTNAQVDEVVEACRRSL
jgi:dTDP-4-amino-4,6-dideoxygalactose transaminase